MGQPLVVPETHARPLGSPGRRRALTGYRSAPGGLCAPGAVGGAWHHANYYNRKWLPATAAAVTKGLPKKPRIHDLRHTHVAWLIGANIPLPAIPLRLGHESISTTVMRDSGRQQASALSWISLVKPPHERPRPSPPAPPPPAGRRGSATDSRAGVPASSPPLSRRGQAVGRSRRPRGRQAQQGLLGGTRRCTGRRARPAPIRRFPAPLAHQESPARTGADGKDGRDGQTCPGGYSRRQPTSCFSLRTAADTDNTAPSDLPSGRAEGVLSCPEALACFSPTPLLRSTASSVKGSHRRAMREARGSSTFGSRPGGANGSSGCAWSMSPRQTGSGISSPRPRTTWPREKTPSQEYEISGGTGAVAAVRLHVVCPVRVPPVRRYCQ